MPSADSAARSGRARSPTLATRSQSSELPGVRRPVGHAASRLRGVGDHLAVEHANLARHLIGEARLVGDHEDGGAGDVELADELDDRCTGGAVEVPGRLVGENDRRAPDEGAGDRNPLPLPSGELAWA